MLQTVWLLFVMWIISTIDRLLRYAVLCGKMPVNLEVVLSILSKYITQMICMKLSYENQVRIYGKLGNLIVLQRRPPKQEGTGSRIPTFVSMSKINHWGVGVT